MYDCCVWCHIMFILFWGKQQVNLEYTFSAMFLKINSEV